jgi:hypothetical protein
VLPVIHRQVSLTRHGRSVDAVYDLLGTSENDVTAALGFTLARSSVFLDRFAQRFPELQGTVMLTMEARDELGRTDLELHNDGALVVIEAKKGWLLPTEAQLRRYVGRVEAAGAGTLATLSEASNDWAAHALPAAVDGVPVRHVRWTDVRDDLEAARLRTRGHERLWLDELHTYLGRAIRVRDVSDSWTFCVVVSNDLPGGGGERTFRDFVDSGVYFHPFGTGGWPKEAPNFMAFRWHGQVQRIQRVTSSEVIPDLQTRWPDIPRDELTERPHAVYQLGPALPGTPIPSGKNYRATRISVLLDQLLIGPTLKDAIANTNRLIGE